MLSLKLKHPFDSISNLNTITHRAFTAIILSTFVGSFTEHFSCWKKRKQYVYYINWKSQPQIEQHDLLRP